MALTTLKSWSSSLNSALHLLPSTSPSKFSKASIFRGYIQARLWKRINFGLMQRSTTVVALIGAGLSLSLLAPGSAFAATELQSLGSSFDFSEPSNALSLPTWAIHVSSVVEWITAMALVWQYGEKPGYESWKGLSWGMVPLLGGAFCACTWHFFYNAESLEVLVAIQAALTVIGNATMCAAAFRIYKASKEESKNT